MYKIKSENKNEEFSWNSLGDVNVGRSNLGDSMPVEVYRLFQFTLRDVLISEIGIEKTNDIIRKSGEIAGKEYFKKFLNKDLDFYGLIALLQKTLKELKIGIFRIEKADLETMELFIVVEEDLDCSGLPVTNETVCDYDEGFIAGILSAYTGEKFTVREIDCWATGARVCRFKANMIK